MILNNAIDIMLGNNAVNKIYLGTNEIWTRENNETSNVPNDSNATNTPANENIN